MLKLTCHRSFTNQEETAMFWSSIFAKIGQLLLNTGVEAAQLQPQHREPECVPLGEEAYIPDGILRMLEADAEKQSSRIE